MKLFQQMLVAGTAMSLIAPIAAQASDSLNHDGMNTYVRNERNSQRIDSKTFVSPVNEELATLEGSVDGLQAQQYDFEAGSFNDTTTLDGKAVMAIGAIDGAETLGKSDKLSTSYVYQLNLNTSFSGDDNLYVRLKAGDGWSGVWDSKPGTYHIEAKDTSDALKVDKIWYTFPVGERFTATVGPKIENYYMLAATPSVYKPGALKAFKLGGHSSAFGASTSTGAGLTYTADNGFAMSTTFNSKKAATSDGLFTQNDQNKINTQVAYTQDNYHLSATYSTQNGWNSWSYYATKDLANGASNVGWGPDSTIYTTQADALALRAWWRPEETGTAMPSVSVGWDTISFSNHGNNITEGSGYMVGLNWSDMIQADDKIGLAIGQPMKATAAESGTTLTEVDPFLWEFYYSFRPNDSIEVTPAIFGGTDVYENTDEDLFGAVVTTTFKF